MIGGFGFAFGGSALNGLGGASANVQVQVPPDLLQIFGSRLAHWWDPDDAGNTLVSGKLDTVVNKGGDLANYSGNMVQATDANRMLCEYLRGDHKAAIHDITAKLTAVATLVGTLAVPYSYVIVKQQWGTSTCAVADGTGTGGLVQTTGTTWPKPLVANSGTALTVSGAVNEDELAVYVITFGGSGVGAIYKNGTLIGSGSTNVGSLATQLFWGVSATGAAWDGAASGDLAVIKGAVSSDDLAAIQTYAVAKYGIGAGTQWVPLGDSNTGPSPGATTTRTAWRGLLSADYSRRKIAGKWLVSNGHQRPFAFADDRHAGIGGQTIPGCNTLINSLFGVGLAYNAGIVTYMIGTNDMGTYAAGTTAAAYANTVRAIDTKINAARGVRPQIVVSTIIDCDPGRTSQYANTRLYNAELQGSGGIWDVLAGEGINLHRVDAFAAVGAYNTTTFYQGDGLGVHMTDAGHALLAPAMRAGLYAAAAAAP